MWNEALGRRTLATIGTQECGRWNVECGMRIVKPIRPFIEQGKLLYNITSVDNLHPCQACHLRYICCGGCRIEDCIFNGKLIGYQGPMLQIKCSQEFISQLERKMIDSYLYYYQF